MTFAGGLRPFPRLLMIDSGMTDREVPVILRPSGVRPEEDGWTADFQVQSLRYHAVLVHDDHVNGYDTETPQYHVDS